MIEAFSSLFEGKEFEETDAVLRRVLPFVIDMNPERTERVGLRGFYVSSWDMHQALGLPLVRFMPVPKQWERVVTKDGRQSRAPAADSVTLFHPTYGARTSPDGVWALVAGFLYLASRDVAIQYKLAR